MWGSNQRISGGEGLKGTEKLEINMKKERDKWGNKKGEGIIGIYIDEKQTQFFLFSMSLPLLIITSPALSVMYLLYTYERYFSIQTHLNKQKLS